MNDTSKGQTVRARPFTGGIAIVLLNIVFWPLALLVTAGYLLFGFVVVPVYLLVTRSRRKARWLIRRLISTYGTSTLRCAWPWVKIRYANQTKDGVPPFIFVANHRAATDAYLMGSMPYECLPVINIWPTKIPIFGRVARLAQYLNVRQMPFEEFQAQGSELLAQGVSIIAFPEGRRSGSSVMGPFHGSIFRLALACGVPIVPVAIHGNERIPPRGSFVLHPGRITITRLPAIGPDVYHDDSPFTLKNRVRDELQSFLDTFNEQASDRPHEGTA